MLTVTKIAAAELSVNDLLLLTVVARMIEQPNFTYIRVEMIDHGKNHDLVKCL